MIQTQTLTCWSFRSAWTNNIIPAQASCLSINDTFVMYRWGKSQNARNIFLLPDGAGEFTRKMGMLVDKSNPGFGMRGWRYSMLVEDGVISKMFIEDGFLDNCPTDPFEISDADTMLVYPEQHRRAA